MIGENFINALKLICLNTATTLAATPAEETTEKGGSGKDKIPSRQPFIPQEWNTRSGNTFLRFGKFNQLSHNKDNSFAAFDAE